MRDEDQLAERLARLRGNTSKKGSSSSAGALQGRLNALSGGRSTEEGAEKDFNSRLASLVSEGEGQSCSADDLNARLTGLSTGGGGGAVDVAAANAQAYHVPEVRGRLVSKQYYSQQTFTVAHMYAHQQ